MFLALIVFTSSSSSKLRAATVLTPLIVSDSPCGIVVTCSVPMIVAVFFSSTSVTSAVVSCALSVMSTPSPTITNWLFSSLAVMSGICALLIVSTIPSKSKPNVVSLNCI